jgi:hypothetical protein
MLEFNPVQELQNRLAKNPLKEADDLTAFIQYASRLAALGDDSKMKEFPALFVKEPFAGNVTDILKQRCEEGWWDVSEYTGKYLALSLIDAQDFKCFMRRFGEQFSEINHYFLKWWQDCEDAAIDDECAEFLEAFLEKFPIPEEERLPVINTPITEREYALLEFAYKNVKIPVITKIWKKKADTSSAVTLPQRKIVEFPVFQAAADGTFKEKQLEFLDSPNNEVETHIGKKLYVSRT